MIQYQKGRTIKQAHVGIPQDLYEEEHGRRGFAGSVSQLYHLHPPTQWTRIEGPIRPRTIRTHLLQPDDLGDARGLPMPVFHNEDVVISVSRRADPMPFCFRNGDGDELHFVHQGRGLIRTDYGPLRFEEGDYLLIPRGTTYQLIPEGRDNLSIVVQARGEIGFPERGNIGHYAPFDYGVIETPEPEAILDDSREWELRIKRRGQLSSVFYDFCPFDVAGWKGNLTALKLNIRDIRPLMSEGVHLPPSAHCTFQAPGFAVCTFLPRPLEGDPEAQRVPWYHRNIDVDEVFFIHGSGFTFTGQPGGAPPGMMFLNPQGLHHGPSKAELEQARIHWRKDARLELKAVNIDCNNPLEMSPQVEAALARGKPAQP